MKKTKYVPSGGLAFFEDKEMKKLAKYAKEGWILEDLAMLGYKLRREEPSDIQYSLDYQKNADDEYFTYFKDAGWSHVCSAGDEIHIFSAPIGIIPIYSDEATTIDKYEREKKQMGKYAFPFFIATVLFMFLRLLSSYGLLSEIAGNISMILGLASLIILIFPGLPYISYRFKLNKLRKG